MLCHFLIFAQHEVGHTTITFNDPDRTGGTGSGGGPGRQIQTEIYYPADIAGDEVAIASGEFPVVVFGHGFVMAWDVYNNIWNYFVSRGYILAFPRTEGGLPPSHEDFGKDLSLVLDKMLDLGQEPISIFYEALNEKSAIMGHSMGGGSTFLAASQNTNVTTIVGLAPAETDPSAETAAASITIPALVLSGERDGVTPDVEHHIPIYEALASECKHFISILGGAHCYFANSSFTCNFGENSSSTGISISREEQQQTTYDAVLPWLDFYLKGMCSRMEDFMDFKDNDSRVETTSSCNYSLPQTPLISEQGDDLESTEGPSYQWFFDGEEISGATNQTVTPVNNGDYTVVITDEYGCTAASAPFTFENALDIEVDFSSNITETCPEGQIQFTDESEEGITEWLWTFEGGTPETSSDQNPSVTYSSAGVYSVSLSVTNAEGTVVEEKEDFIIVYSTPSVGIEFDKDEICIGESIELGATGASSYEWSDGFGTSPSITDTPTETTTYSVVGTDGNGCESEAELEVTVNDLPVVSAGSDVTICIGESVTLLGSGAVTYDWDNNVQNGVPFGPNQTTTYTVIGTSVNGCTSSDDVEVVVNSLPEIGIEFESDEICKGETVQLSAYGGETYSWEGGFGADETIFVSPTETTVYDVQGTDENGCIGNGQVEIMVNIPADITIVASHEEVCQGDDVTLTASGADSYVWGDDLGTTQSIMVNPSETTVYSVVGIDANGCEAVSEVGISVIEIPAVEIEAHSVTVCEGESIELTAVGADAFVWADGLGTDATVTVTPDGEMIYSVVGTNGGLCSNEAEITITTVTTPVVVASASKEEVCEGEMVTLTASGAEEYVWDHGVIDGVSFSPITTTTYTVVGTSSCGVGTASVTVVVNPLPDHPEVSEENDVLSVSASGDETVVWILDGEVVSDNASFEPEEDGVYVVQVTNEFGCTSENEYQFESTTAIGGENLSYNLSVYPNPTSGKFVLELSGKSKSVTISLVDVLGRIVLSKGSIELVNTTQVSFDITGMKPGVYMLVVETGLVKEMRRVVLK